MSSTAPVTVPVGCSASSENVVAGSSRRAPPISPNEECSAWAAPVRQSSSGSSICWKGRPVCEEKLTHSGRRAQWRIELFIRKCFPKRQSS
eukprot:5281052-Prymnesium_polylepis.1